MALAQIKKPKRGAAASEATASAAAAGAAPMAPAVTTFSISPPPLRDPATLAFLDSLASTATHADFVASWHNYLITIREIIMLIYIYLDEDGTGALKIELKDFPVCFLKFSKTALPTDLTAAIEASKSTIERTKCFRLLEQKINDFISATAIFLGKEGVLTLSISGITPIIRPITPPVAVAGDHTSEATASATPHDTGLIPLPKEHLEYIYECLTIFGARDFPFFTQAALVESPSAEQLETYKLLQRKNLQIILQKAQIRVLSDEIKAFSEALHKKTSEYIAEKVNIMFLENEFRRVQAALTAAHKKESDLAAAKVAELTTAHKKELELAVARAAELTSTLATSKKGDSSKDQLITRLTKELEALRAKLSAGETLRKTTEATLLTATARNTELEAALADAVSRNTEIAAASSLITEQKARLEATLAEATVQIATLKAHAEAATIAAMLKPITPEVSSPPKSLAAALSVRMQKTLAAGAGAGGGAETGLLGTRIALDVFLAIINCLIAVNIPLECIAICGSSIYKEYLTSKDDDVDLMIVERPDFNLETALIKLGFKKHTKNPDCVLFKHPYFQDLIKVDIRVIKPIIAEVAEAPLTTIYRNAASACLNICCGFLVFEHRPDRTLAAKLFAPEIPTCPILGGKVIEFIDPNDLKRLVIPKTEILTLTLNKLRERLGKTLGPTDLFFYLKIWHRFKDCANVTALTGVLNRTLLLSENFAAICEVYTTPSTSPTSGASMLLDFIRPYLFEEEKFTSLLLALQAHVKKTYSPGSEGHRKSPVGDTGGTATAITLMAASASTASASTAAAGGAGIMYGAK
jgi:hypothetical protein